MTNTYTESREFLSEVILHKLTMVKELRPNQFKAILKMMRRPYVDVVTGPPEDMVGDWKLVLLLSELYASITDEETFLKEYFKRYNAFFISEAFPKEARDAAKVNVNIDPYVLTATALFIVLDEINMLDDTDT